MAQGKMTASDEDILNWMREKGDPAYVTVEVADQFDMTTEATRGRLYDIEQEGELMSKKPGSRTIVWWLPECYDERVCSQ